MKKKRSLIFIGSSLVLMLVLLLAGCVSTPPNTPPAETQPAETPAEQETFSIKFSITASLPPAKSGQTVWTPMLEELQKKRRTITYTIISAGFMWRAGGISTL